MSAEYVPLALIMFAFTYPSRAVGLLAPAMDRLPRPALEYLQLVGPAVLTALAAVDIMVGVENGESVFTIGLPWLSVVVCLLLVVWRRNLFVGLVAAVAIAAVARALGFG
jgi:branched-subunit amino acid transport protein